MRHIRALISGLGKYDTTSTAFICFSAAGFTNELRGRAAEDTNILLIGAEKLYGFQSQ